MPAPRFTGNFLTNSAAAIAICCGCIVAFVALAPGLPAPQLDSGWQFGMNEATAMGLVGKGLVFTFGPYASLYTSQYFPATNGLMLAGDVLLAAAAIAGSLCLARAGTWVAAVGAAQACSGRACMTSSEAACPPYQNGSSWCGASLR